MKKGVLCFLLASMAALAEAQYIPAFRDDIVVKKDPGEEYWGKGNTFRHLEMSLSVGTAGVGLDLAMPVCKWLQVRLGYDYMPPFKKRFNMNLAGGGEAARQYNEQGNRVRTPFDRISQYLYEQTGMDLQDHIVMTGQMTMRNAKMFLDFFPMTYNKHWHITAGVYWGPEEIAQAENDPVSDRTIALMANYNQNYAEAGSGDAISSYGRLTLYPGDYVHDVQKGLTLHRKGDPYLPEPTADGKVSISVKSNAIKPYVGVGYTGRLTSSRDDWKVSAELGVMIWGGTPSQRMDDGMNLSKDVMNIPGTMGSCVRLIEALKVYPVLSVRFAKTLF